MKNMKKKTLILMVGLIGLLLLPSFESKATCRYLCTNSVWLDCVVYHTDGFTICLNGRGIQEV
jgi:hypothetical protein